MMLKQPTSIFLALLQAAESLVFLSDLPTPTFVLDISAVQRVVEGPIPPIQLPNANKLLIADPLYDDSPHEFSKDATPVDLLDSQTINSASGETCYGFIHTRVKVPRTDDFVAELDVPEALNAHLVLGLNNHHVGSYYWARSAGAGAGMEAPGIILKGNKLFWEASEYKDCNSNDGKRSEWVNFLKEGDQVQLRPANTEETLLKFEKIYGVSSFNRPLGAEPVVVCEFRVLSTADD